MKELNQGFCRFCGQAVQYEDIDWTIPEDANQGATFNCKCDQAKEYTRIEQKKVTAEQKIKVLFGEGAKGNRFPDELLEVLEAGVNLVIQGKASKLQTEYLNVKAKITITAKGDVKIERSETNKRALEV